MKWLNLSRERNGVSWEIISPGRSLLGARGRKSWSKWQDEHANEEPKTFRVQVKDLGEKLESIIYPSQNQITTLERKGHDHWTRAQEAERNLFNSRQEIANTRQRTREAVIKLELLDDDPNGAVFREPLLWAWGAVSSEMGGSQCPSCQKNLVFPVNSNGKFRTRRYVLPPCISEFCRETQPVGYLCRYKELPQGIGLCDCEGWQVWNLYSRPAGWKLSGGGRNYNP